MYDRLLGNDFNKSFMDCIEYEYFKKAIANVVEDYSITKKESGVGS